MAEQWWSWRQSFRHWKYRATEKPTKPGASPGTTVADLAQGGPFLTMEEAEADAKRHGFTLWREANIWDEPSSNWPPGTLVPNHLTTGPQGQKE